jgi:hypothetical protein
MKLVIRTVVFHSICIIVFSFIYLYFRDDFKSLAPSNSNEEKNETTYIDFLLLSTTVQCSVGLSDLVPINSLGKLCLTIQQYIMLLTHVITLYVFTL